MGFLCNDEVLSYGGINIKGMPKACTYDDYFSYWRDNLFERLMRLFIYDLDEDIQQKEIEERLYIQGHTGIAKCEQNDNKVTAFFGSFYGPTVYQDEFTHYTVFSPVYSNTLKIDEDVAIIENNSLKNPSLEHVIHYAQLLAHTEVTLIKSLIEARDSGGVPIAQNEKAKQSLLAYQKAMYQGKINVVSDLAGIGVEYLGADRHTSLKISEVWEVRKNLVKSFYADIGVRASFDKKSNAVVDEVTSDSSMLLYNVADMLETRKLGLEKVNKLFDKNYSVRLADEIDYNDENQPEDLTVDEEGGKEDAAGN